MTAEERGELDRLASALGKAFGSTATGDLRPYADDCVYAFVSDRDRNIETAAQPTVSAALAELRAILRADTDGAVNEAVAAVLDELAALADEGPITAEMLRTMAAARRAR